MLLTAPNGIALSSQADIHVSADGQINHSAGSSINLSTQNKLVGHAQQKISLFAAGQGISAVAAKDNIALQAQSDGIEDYNIASFSKISTDIITGPARLYRVTSPANGAFGECWVTEEVFIKIKNSPDPKAAWRKYLAVWPDWNANGQFVIYDIPAGQSIKVWRGPASSQTKDALGDSYNLSGGWEQIIFKEGKFDNTIYYPMDSYGRLSLKSPIRRDAYNNLSPAEKAKYQAVRSRIKEPNIHGPYDTNWGMTDFDEQLKDVRIGLPNIAGQVINR